MLLNRARSFVQAAGVYKTGRFDTSVLLAGQTVNLLSFRSEAWGARIYGLRHPLPVIGHLY